MEIFSRIAEIFALARADQKLQLMAIVIIYTVMSIATLIMYGLDKAAARRRGARISERTLLVCGLACGWPGALLAQSIFRHKTIKVSFRLAFATTIIFNCLALAMFLFWPAVSLNVLM